MATSYRAPSSSGRIPRATTALYDNCTYTLHRTAQTVRLVQHFLSEQNVMGAVRDWRVPLLEAVERASRDRNERERGYRLRLALKVLNSLRSPQEAPRFLEAMRRITLEEAIFWNWQYNTYGRDAIRAFKTIHMRSRRNMRR